MLTFGIIGLGPHWETTYFPALCRVRHKVAIRAVYDPVASRAEQIAASLNAKSYEGIAALIDEAKVRAFLMLDPGWYRDPWLRALCSGHKPVYVAGDLGVDAERMLCLHDQAKSCGQLIMPEMVRRYDPSTIRLQELVATQLGRAVSIVIEADMPATSNRPDPWSEAIGQSTMMELFDWCRNVTRTQPTSVESRHASGEAAIQQAVRLQFAKPRLGGAPSVAEIRLNWPAGQSKAGGNGKGPHILRKSVACERGTATLLDDRQIEWSLAGGEPVAEALSTDRSAVEVMLDQFCRRVAGGLLPVADMADICRGLRIARSVGVSQERGGPVEITG